MRRRSPRDGRPAYWEDAFTDYPPDRKPNEPPAPRPLHPVIARALRRRVERHNRIRYEESGNPLYLWEVYRDFRRLGLDVPDWVLSYLDHVAVALLDSKVEPKDDHFIAQALDLDVGRGERSAFKDFDRESSNRSLGPVVASCITQGDQETYAIERVAKRFGVHESTVRRAYKDWEEFCQEHPVSRDDGSSET